MKVEVAVLGSPSLIVLCGLSGHKASIHKLFSKNSFTVRVTSHFTFEEDWDKRNRMNEEKKKKKKKEKKKKNKNKKENRTKMMVMLLLYY